MCSRFSIAVDSEELMHFFDADMPKDFTKRYNFAPSQEGLVYHDGRLGYMRWGIEAPFAGHPMINARSEGVQESKFFTKFLTHKCLVPADGFYEWKKVGSDKIPYRFTIGSLFVFPGLYDKETQRFAILTTTPNEVVKKVHNRMPVVLNKEEGIKWLEDDFSVLKPFKGDMKSEVLSKRINSPRVEGSDLLKPDAQQRLF